MDAIINAKKIKNEISKNFEKRKLETQNVSCERLEEFPLKDDKRPSLS